MASRTSATIENFGHHESFCLNQENPITDYRLNMFLEECGFENLSHRREPQPPSRTSVTYRASVAEALEAKEALCTKIFNTLHQQKLLSYKNSLFATYHTLLKAYTYILECSDGSYYTGSTIDLEIRVQQHNEGYGANHTRKRHPVKLIYYEEYTRIDLAFYREKQIQGWSRKKKEALINGEPNLLPKLSIAYRDVRKE